MENAHWIPMKEKQQQNLREKLISIQVVDTQFKLWIPQVQDDVETLEKFKSEPTEHKRRENISCDGTNAGTETGLRFALGFALRSIRS